MTYRRTKKIAFSLEKLISIAAISVILMMWVQLARAQDEGAAQINIDSSGASTTVTTNTTNSTEQAQSTSPATNQPAPKSGNEKCSGGTLASQQACKERNLESQVTSLEKQLKTSKEASQKAQQQDNASNNNMGMMLAAGVGALMIGKGVMDISTGMTENEANPTTMPGTPTILLGAFEVLGGIGGLAAAMMMGQNAGKSSGNAAGLDSLSAPSFGVGTGSGFDTSSGAEFDNGANGVGLSTAANKTDLFEGKLGADLDQFEEQTGLDRGEVFDQLQAGNLDPIADKLGISTGELQAGIQNAISDANSGASELAEADAADALEEEAEAVQLNGGGGLNATNGSESKLSGRAVASLSGSLDKEKKKKNDDSFKYKLLSKDIVKKLSKVGHTYDSVFMRVRKKLNAFEAEIKQHGLKRKRQLASIEKLIESKDKE